MSCYLSCPQKHHFSYVQNLKRKGVARPLSFGGDFHKLLEHRNDKEKLKETIKTIRGVYNDLSGTDQGILGENYIQDLKTVFQDYQKVWKGAEQPTETEHEFLIRLGKVGDDPIYFHGLMDEIYEGGILGEHKTFTRKPDMFTLAMNTQACVMAKAWMLETGERLEKVRWDYIHSQPSTLPIFLEKSGRFSEAKNAKITPMSWLRACKAQGIDDPEILAKAELYRGNIREFFFKVDFDFVPSMVDTVWDTFKYMCREISVRGVNNKTKNITRDCTWCNYKDICFAEFTGANVAYIIKKDFVVSVRDDWSQDVEVE